MAIRGIRGATTVDEDRPEAILAATRELLEHVMRANRGLRTEDIGSAFFSTTSDLCSAYPAQAARQMGWEAVPLICALEIPVPGSLPRAIRVLIHWNTDVLQSEIQHVYLRQAVKLRLDIYRSLQTAQSSLEEEQP